MRAHSGRDAVMITGVRLYVEVIKMIVLTAKEGTLARGRSDIYIRQRAAGTSGHLGHLGHLVIQKVSHVTR